MRHPSFQAWPRGGWTWEQIVNILLLVVKGVQGIACGGAEAVVLPQLHWGGSIRRRQWLNPSNRNSGESPFRAPTAGRFRIRIGSGSLSTTLIEMARPPVASALVL